MLSQRRRNVNLNRSYSCHGSQFKVDSAVALRTYSQSEWKEEERGAVYHLLIFTKCTGYFHGVDKRRIRWRSAHNVIDSWDYSRVHLGLFCGFCAHCSYSRSSEWPTFLFIPPTQKISSTSWTDQVSYWFCLKITLLELFWQ